MRALFVCVVAFALLAAPAQAAKPCEDWCSVTLRAKDDVRKWKSPERFGQGYGGAWSIEVVIRRRGKRLREDFSKRNGERCLGYFWRKRLQGRTDTCGDPTRVRLRYRGKGKFKVKYRAFY